jgi:hypothetical protein
MTEPLPPPAGFARAHLSFGWVALAVFALLGLTLEALHGFKVPIYLDVGHGTRRLMWTLSHAHGTLLALVNLAFAATADGGRWTRRGAKSASFCLRAATLLVPVGFFLGGVRVHGGDPGLGVLLVPLGGVLLVVGLAVTASSMYAATR